MRLLRFAKSAIPALPNAVLAVLSALLSVFAFPDFDYAWLIYVALIPLLIAIRRESDCLRRTFSVGWIYGTVFFFGTCWWLTFAPITYAHLPAIPVYFVMLGVAAAAGLFPAVFAVLYGVARRRYGIVGLLFVPLFWTAAEFLRMWVTGNNWNAVGYSLAFIRPSAIELARIGGVYAVSFFVLAVNAFFTSLIEFREVMTLLVYRGNRTESGRHFELEIFLAVAALAAGSGLAYFGFAGARDGRTSDGSVGNLTIVAVQPNVPMDGLTIEKYEALLDRHVELAGIELKRLPPGDASPRLVVFPESPMMFQYGEDERLREYFRRFAERNRTGILFNSAERSSDGKQLMNSAVLLNDSGAKVGQYDKIFLLPFGEFIPFPEPVASWMPAFVGNFKRGTEYDLLPVGGAKAGVMICFESHFGGLSAQYTRGGANFLIEMTNDGYLGNTPVLRQHLANTVFRAIETGRPVIRTTNVGITGLITPDGAVLDSPPAFEESVRAWRVDPIVSGLTIYSTFGDAWAIICSVIAIFVLIVPFFGRSRDAAS